MTSRRSVSTPVTVPPINTRVLKLSRNKSTHRRGDVTRRQCCSRHLVQQGLKQVIIVAIEQPHLHASAAQPGRTAGAAASPETCPDRRSPFGAVKEPP